MGKALKLVRHEVRELLPAFIFFSIAFAIVIFTNALFVRGESVSPMHLAEALILGFIVSKAMLIADALPFIDAFGRSAAAYNTAWKTVLYTTAAVSIYFLERVVEALTRHHSLAREFGSIRWSRFWMVVVWLLVAFLIYVGYSEIDRRLGSGKLRKLFFSKSGDAPLTSL